MTLILFYFKLNHSEKMRIYGGQISSLSWLSLWIPHLAQSHRHETAFLFLERFPRNPYEIKRITDFRLQKYWITKRLAFSMSPSSVFSVLGQTACVGLQQIVLPYFKMRSKFIIWVITRVRTGNFSYIYHPYFYLIIEGILFIAF